MDYITKDAILYESNELINKIADWVKIRNTKEKYPIEAVAITYNGYYYKTSYMCFGWEERNPNVRDKSIWKWWSDEKIITKFKFKNADESMDSKKVLKIVQKTIFNLQKKIKKQQIKQKLREIEHVFE